MKIKFLVVLFLVSFLQNAEGSKESKSGSRIGKMMMCALYCASGALSTDSQANEIFHIRNVESQQGWLYDALRPQCSFEGCYCPHDIINDSNKPVPAYFHGTAEEIYDKYCTADELHDKNVNKLSRFEKTLRFCERLIKKAGSCLTGKGVSHWNLQFYVSNWNHVPLYLPKMSVKEKEDYLNASVPRILCNEEGPESCNCSCSYRILGKGKYYQSSVSGTVLRTKETRGKLTEDSYDVSTEDTLNGNRTWNSMKWKKSALKKKVKKKSDM